MYRNTKQFSAAGSKRRKKGGFTMVEILISMSIMAVLVTSIMSFYLQFYRTAFANEQRNMINRDIRTLTARLSEDGRQANYFILYRSHELTDRNNEKDRLSDGESGDLLVFVYSEPPKASSVRGRTSKLVGYFRDATAGQSGPVRRFEVELDPASPAQIEALFPNQTRMAESPQVVELSRGLADGRLFYNFWGRSVMVNGQIYHGNEAKRVTETYNFTVSPRG